MSTTTESQSPASKDQPATTTFWAGRSALIMPAILVGIAIFLFVGIGNMKVAGDSELFGPKAFPTITAVACLIIAALLVISILRNPEVPDIAESEDGTTPATLSNWRSVAIVFGTLVLFVILLETAGWIIAAALLFTGVATGLGSKRYGLNALIGLAMSSIIQLVFVGGLGLSLPAGIMGVF